MAEQLRVFVSHSHKDNKFCQQIVQALRNAGADVWYDEHNLTSGRLGPIIERELRSRTVFVVILTPAALNSHWVEDETRWAYGLLRKDARRIMLPITAATVQEDDVWLFLQEFRRIEAPGCKPYPVKEATRRLLHALALTPAGEAPAPIAPQPTEDMDDLLTRGKALAEQGKYIEALPFFEYTTKLASGSFVAWAGLGYILGRLGRRQEALAAYNRALALNDNNAATWYNKGIALNALNRHEEALAAFDRALALDTNFTSAWSHKSAVLAILERYDEALAACDQALALDPNDAADVWKIRAIILRNLGRTAEAEVAEKRAKELGWTG